MVGTLLVGGASLAQPSGSIQIRLPQFQISLGLVSPYTRHAHGTMDTATATAGAAAAVPTPTPATNTTNTTTQQELTRQQYDLAKQLQSPVWLDTFTPPVGRLAGMHYIYGHCIKTCLATRNTT